MPSFITFLNLDILPATFTGNQIHMPDTVGLKYISPEFKNCMLIVQEFECIVDIIHSETRVDLMSGNNNSISFELNISNEDFLNYYIGVVKNVVVTTADNKTFQFPASFIQKFLCHDGIRGKFKLIYDQNHKLVSINRLSYWLLSINIFSIDFRPLISNFKSTRLKLAVYQEIDYAWDNKVKLLKLL